MSQVRANAEAFLKEYRELCCKYNLLLGQDYDGTYFLYPLASELGGPEELVDSVIAEIRECVLYKQLEDE